MADYLYIFPADDSHIDFMVENPETLWSYIDGQYPAISETLLPAPTLWQRLTGNVPKPKATLEVPSNWPDSEPTAIGPEINHRNVDLYHLILNGTTEFVTGGGSIFQTWLEAWKNRTHSAIDITGDFEHFAFYSNQLPILLDVILSVDTEKVMVCFNQWLRAKGEDYTPSKKECEEIANEFAQFANSTRKAISEAEGLIWISS